MNRVGRAVAHKLPVSNHPGDPPQCSFCSSTVRAHWPAANIWKCFSCGLLLRHPLPSSRDLAALYDASWREPEVHNSETGSTDRELAREYAKHLAAALGRCDLQNLSILEFGAGKGGMQIALQELGAEAVAIEPFGHDYLIEQGFRAYRSLDELPKAARFDGIVSLQVVEHLVSPWEDLRALHFLLRPSGWALVTTVNAAGLNARLTRANWREARKPGHIVFFDSGSLQKTMQRAGFARCKRLHWYLDYGHPLHRRLLLHLAQIAGLDGELCMLAWKGSS